MSTPPAIPSANTATPPIASSAPIATPTPSTSPAIPSGMNSPSPVASAASPVSSAATGQSTAATPLVFSTVGDLCGVDAGVKTMVYAEAGMGKTVLMATLPMPFVIVSTENGLLSLSAKNLTKIFMLLGMDPESAAQRAQMVRQQTVITVRTGIQLKQAYEYIVANAGKFRSVGWDSASETGEAMLIAAKAVKADGRQAYGEVADIIGDYFKKFRDGLPGKHVCIVAKQGTVQDGVTGKIKAGPDFPGKQLGAATPYLLDETFVIRAGIDTNTNLPFRYLQTQPDDSFVAKDRSGLLDLYERPDLSYLIDKITAQ